MSVTIFVPSDAAALALGADGVAQAVAAEARRRGLEIRLVRNGSRGLFWLEPMLEVATPAGRIAYGPVASGDVAGLFVRKRGPENAETGSVLLSLHFLFTELRLAFGQTTAYRVRRGFVSSHLTGRQA